ncbi:MAG TPA: molybdate ABC transporter substrate-binding protein, partial [Candidatus Dormibacteraeota bacterium]|nr:molybdate ABC transporter substrate-binding protein [Candidatus Dormibacteraeota bacterium]
MSAARRAGAPAAGWRPARAGGGAAAPGASLAAAFLLAAATLAGCGGTPAASGASPAALSGDLTLLAAASLTEGFTDLAKDFERRHPGVHVHLSFAGSPTLAAQVEQGAPADLIATADAATIDRLAGEGLLNGTPETVATNRLEIAVAHGNPAGVHGLADLARPGLRVALCAATVPCGKGAATALARAGVQVSPVTLDPDVKSVLS